MRSPLDKVMPELVAPLDTVYVVICNSLRFSIALMPSK
jgi:hypothetical protein